MANLTPSPKMQFFTANGVPLSGGKLYTFSAGTTTPLATYTDSTGGTPNTNPVILDARGEANVWLGSSPYYMELHDSLGTLIWSVDNIAAPATLAALAASGGSALIGFIQSGTGAVARTAQSKMRESVSVRDFGAVGNGIESDSLAIQNAAIYLDSIGGGDLFFPKGTYKANFQINLLKISIIGDQQGTILIPDSISVPIISLFGRYTNTNVASKRRISNVNFLGSTQTGIGVYNNSFGSVIFENVSFNSLEYGIYNNASEWNRYENTSFVGNKYGMVCTCKNNDILGNNPSFPQNSSEQYLIDCVFTSNNLAFYSDSINTPYVDASSSNVFIGVLFNGNTCAYAHYDSFQSVTAPGARFDSCWFESNTPAGGTQIFNGNTITNADIYSNNGKIFVTNTVLPKIILASSYLKGISIGITDSTLFSVDTLSFVEFDGIYFEQNSGGIIDFAVCKSPTTLPGKSIVVKIQNRSGETRNYTNLVGNYAVVGGIGANPTVWNGTPTFSTGTSGLKNNKSIRITAVANDAFAFATTYTANKWYVRTYSLKSISGNTSLSLIQSTAGQGVNGNINFTTSWNTFAVIGQSLLSGFGYFIFSANGSCVLEIDAIQEIEFNTQSEAIAYLNSDSFAMPHQGSYPFSGYGTAAPTTGQWYVGDRINNSVPSIGQPKSWVCTVSGTPGTWVSEGNL